ncbi:MAG: hypothetical protein H0T78_06035 [Longispora sp.]|nr:hypothetical protein [Longispora sp. (in: high G+C Gram-positive bacteria)]
MKFKILARATVGVLALTGVVLTQSLPAKDVTTQIRIVSVDAPDLEEKVKAFQETSSELSEEKLSLLSTSIFDQLGSGAVTIHLPAEASLQVADIHGVEISSEKTMVQIPIRGGNVVEPSNLSFFVDTASGATTNIIEVQYVTDAKDSSRGRVTQWDNGRIILDKLVTADGRVSSPGEAASLATGVQEIQLKFNWGKFNACLASHGIAAWTIGAIGAACGIACAATLGLGCAVCIASIGGISTGVITNCVKRANRR